MSVFSKYCDKLIFESVNDIEISDNDIIAELDNSGYVDCESFNELKSIINVLVAKGYQFSEGYITTIDEMGLMEHNLTKLNLKSTSPEDLTFVSSLGKVFISKDSAIEVYLTSDDPSWAIELQILSKQKTPNETFTLNGEVIKKLFIILKPTKA